MMVRPFRSVMFGLGSHAAGKTATMKVFEDAHHAFDSAFENAFKDTRDFVVSVFGL